MSPGCCHCPQAEAEAQAKEDAARLAARQKAEAAEVARLEAANKQLMAEEGKAARKLQAEAEEVGAKRSVCVAVASALTVAVSRMRGSRRRSRRKRCASWLLDARWSTKTRLLRSGGKPD